MLAEKIRTFPSEKPQQKYITKERIETIIDENGEETTHSLSEFRVPSEPSFIKLYLEDIALLHRLPKGINNLMYELVKQTNYEGLIILNPYMREKISNSVGFTNKQSLNNGISKLVKENILRRVGQGVYEINPFIFGKGDWKTIFKRRENFKLTIEYLENGDRKISSSLAEEGENNE